MGCSIVGTVALISSSVDDQAAALRTEQWDPCLPPTPALPYSGDASVFDVRVVLSAGVVPYGAGYATTGVVLPVSGAGVDGYAGSVTAMLLSFNGTSGAGVVRVMRTTESEPVSSRLSELRVLVQLPGSMVACVVGRDRMVVPVHYEAPPTVLGAGERAAVAVVATMSAAAAATDLQAVAVLALSACSSGSDGDNESSVRALVPIALTNTCEGAVGGALVGIGGAAIACGAVVVFLMTAKRASFPTLLCACSQIRCPSVVLLVWAMMQTGLLTCGVKLLQVGDAGSGGSIALGVVGVVLGVTPPFLYWWVARGVASRRCYRLAPTGAVPCGRAGRALCRVLFFRYELDMDVYPMSKCFATVVNKTRRPHWIWAGLPVLSPVVLLLVILAEGNGCSPLLLTAGVVHVCIGLVWLWFLPQRQLSSNVLQSLGILTNGVLLIASGGLARTPGSEGLIGLCHGLSVLQTCLSTTRTINTAVCWLLNKFFRQTWLMRVDSYRAPRDECLGGGWCGNGWAHDDVKGIEDPDDGLGNPLASPVPPPDVAFVFEFRAIGWCADTDPVEEGPLEVPMEMVYIGITDEERARVQTYIRNLSTIEVLRSQGLLPPPPPPKRRRPPKPPTNLLDVL